MPDIPLPPEPPVYRDRTGRELPLDARDARGVPVCPRCFRSDCVRVASWGEPYCGFCRRSVRWVEPRPHAPDFCRPAAWTRPERSWQR